MTNGRAIHRAFLPPPRCQWLALPLSFCFYAVLAGPPGFQDSFESGHYSFSILLLPRGNRIELIDERTGYLSRKKREEKTHLYCGELSSDSLSLTDKKPNLEKRKASDSEALFLFHPIKRLQKGNCQKDLLIQSIFF